jgi:hypothetical protein
MNTNKEAAKVVLAKERRMIEPFGFERRNAM